MEDFTESPGEPNSGCETEDNAQSCPREVHWICH